MKPQPVRLGTPLGLSARPEHVMNAKQWGIYHLDATGTFTWYRVTENPPRWAQHSQDYLRRYPNGEFAVAYRGTWWTMRQLRDLRARTPEANELDEAIEALVQRVAEFKEANLPGV